MSTKRCYYETLEVERSADESGLKVAFRKLAMKWHPDKNPGDQSSEVRFKEINEAYEVLKDPEKRSAYDRFGHAAFQGPGPRGPAGAGGFHDPFDIFREVFGQGSGGGGIFDEMFGGGRRDSGRDGSDLRYDLEITLEEAAS